MLMGEANPAKATDEYSKTAEAGQRGWRIIW